LWKIGVQQNHMLRQYHWQALMKWQGQILLAIKVKRIHSCKAFGNNFSVRTVQFINRFLAYRHCLIWPCRASTMLISILTWIAQLEKKHKQILKQLWYYFWWRFFYFAICFSVYDWYFSSNFNLCYWFLKLLKILINCTSYLIS